eukprot:487610_1
MIQEVHMMYQMELALTLIMFAKKLKLVLSGIRTFCRSIITTSRRKGRRNIPIAPHPPPPYKIVRKTYKIVRIIYGKEYINKNGNEYDGKKYNDIMVMNING